MYEKIDAYVRRLIRESSPEYTVWNIEKVRQGKPASWNYIDGCMITALISMAKITGDRRYFDFAERFIDSFIGEDGSIRTYDPDRRSLDDVNEGRVLFDLFALTGKEKYRAAARRLHDELMRQPRTAEGSFWHKKIYPNQVWLDGVYMAQPFAALFEKHFGSGDYGDVARQVDIVRARMRDERTGLYYHGYDASRQAFWADPETGCSKSFWLRAIGWFSVALADLLEIIPPGAARDILAETFAGLMESAARYADGGTGLYWQVVDKAGEPGNYLESSGSSMLAYAMLKGARLGALPAGYAALGRKTFEGIVKKYLSFEEGQLELGGICLVAGLGPQDNRRRDGTFGYYVSEPVGKNEAKGVAQLILC